MNTLRAINRINTICRISLGAAFFFVLVISCVAQRRQPNRQPRISPIDKVRAGNAEMIRREAILNDLKRTPDKTAPMRENMMVLKQIREDYLRLQVLNNEMMSAATRGGTLDYKHLGEQSTEINKRAQRLRKTLSLSEPEAGEDTQKHLRAGGDADLKTLLVSLDKRIINFIENPYFKNPNVINAHDSLAASADLQSIIETSHSIKKKCKEME